ncbi:hypothetical protein E5D57_012346 [Metarhizium anisopliae]|nr:hypothetical protein E5D57_012346 [Metarhizium anisopliae]
MDVGKIQVSIWRGKGDDSATKTQTGREVTGMELGRRHQGESGLSGRFTLPESLPINSSKSGHDGVRRHWCILSFVIEFQKQMPAEHGPSFTM